MYDVLTRLVLPSCATALHTGFEETLAGRLDVASAKRQTKSARPGVVHTIGVGAMTLYIGDGCMDGMIRADTLIHARCDQLLQNAGGRADPVQQVHLPTPEPFVCRCGIVNHASRRPQLLHEVVQINQAVEVVTELANEALLQQIPHLRGPVAE